MKNTFPNKINSACFKFDERLNLGNKKQLIQEILSEKRTLIIDIVDPKNTKIGHLSPLTISDVNNEKLIGKFTRWRNQLREGYLDQSVITDKSTQNWLRRLLEDATRLAFLIYFKDQLIGRAGFLNLTSSSIEGDGLVRGERGGGLNFIYYTDVALITWEFENLSIDSIRIKILSTNEIALHLHQKLNFKIEKEVDIYLHEQAERKIILEQGKHSQKMREQKLIYMTLSKQDFFAMKKSVWNLKGV